MTFRLTRASISRSWAGVSSLSKMTASTSASSQAAARKSSLAATEERRGIGTWTLLRHAEDDLPASGMSQAGELVKGLLGGMTPLRAGNETDERDALVSCVRRGT
jgi:hypothetical protein